MIGYCFGFFRISSSICLPSLISWSSEKILTPHWMAGKAKHATTMRSAAAGSRFTGWPCASSINHGFKDEAPGWSGAAGFGPVIFCQYAEEIVGCGIPPAYIHHGTD